MTSPVDAVVGIDMSRHGSVEADTPRRSRNTQQSLIDAPYREPFTGPSKTGALVYVGEHNLGGYQRFSYYRCSDCGTDYPGGQCNGKSIGGLCPFCRPDSKPWTNGRGL